MIISYKTYWVNGEVEQANWRKDKKRSLYPINILAMAYKAQGDFEKAIKMIELTKKISDAESPNVVQVVDNLAVRLKKTI